MRGINSELIIVIQRKKIGRHTERIESDFINLIFVPFHSFAGTHHPPDYDLAPSFYPSTSKYTTSKEGHRRKNNWHRLALLPACFMLKLNIGKTHSRRHDTPSHMNNSILYYMDELSRLVVIVFKSSAQKSDGKD